MSNLTASRTSGRFGLTYGVGREIVVVHISLGSLHVVDAVQFLALRQWSQGTYVENLCLSTGKHTGTVYSRKQINLSRQRTNLRDTTAVRTLVVLENHVADCLLLILVKRLAQHVQPLFVVCKCLL